MAMKLELYDHLIEATDNINNPTGLPVNIVAGGTGGGTVEAGDSFKDAQHPLATNGDSIYSKDIDITRSNMYNFSGVVTDLFDNLHSVNTDASSNTPKEMLIHLKRTLLLNGLGLGSSDGGNFSNVKITLILSGGSEIIVYDNSSDNTKRTTEQIRFSVIGVNAIIQSIFPTNAIKIEFYTADEVQITNLYAPKFTTNLSIIQGQTPDGNYREFQATDRGSFKVALTEYQGDAFGRLRVSEPHTIFDNSLTNEVSDNLFWSTLINGTATGNYVKTHSRFDLIVNNIGDYLIRQTKQRFKYQPGKSHEVLITGLLNTDSGIRKRVGLLDYDNPGLGTITTVPQNGIFFENNNGVLSWNIANNGVITESAIQSTWNSDKCDGNGHSKFLLNINDTNIFFTDLEWLGVGNVRCGFVNKSGEIVIAHQFNHASSGFSDVYMRTANLPISYEITALTGTTGTLKQICSSVISEGGFNPKGIFRGIENTIAGVTVSQDEIQTLLGIRLKNDFFEYSVEVDSISTLAESSGDGRWYLLFNPTLDGTAVWADENNSVLQKSESNFEVLDKGLIISGGMYSSDNDASSATIATALRLGKSLLGDLDEIWLAIFSYSSEKMHGFINVRESL